MTHIRRGFTDSLKSGPCCNAALIVLMIRRLDLIEAELRKKIHDLPVEAYPREWLTVLPGTTDPEVIAWLTPARIAAARRNKPARENAA